ncbi:MAG: cytochrome c [Rhodocyclaceae bacterium]|nr:MAG: cytochrome c [Rhodocyclaceae bacterium]
MQRGLGLVMSLMAAVPALAQSSQPTLERQQTLIHMVRQDCGSCHGLTLKGGLGPALTADALHERSMDALAATIINGRPGTPMPPFQGLLNEADVQWIARQLLAGFPEIR